MARHQTQMIASRLPGGHNKWNYDRWGNWGQHAIDTVMKEETVAIKSGDSPAKVVCAQLNKKYEDPVVGKRETDIVRFHYVPANELKPRHSDLKTLKACNGQGVQSFHCARIDTDGSLAFQRNSCFCQSAQSSKFREDCSHTDRGAGWHRVKKSHKSRGSQ